MISTTYEKVIFSYLKCLFGNLFFWFVVVAAPESVALAVFLKVWICIWFATGLFCMAASFALHRTLFGVLTIQPNQYSSTPVLIIITNIIFTLGAAAFIKETYQWHVYGWLLGLGVSLVSSLQFQLNRLNGKSNTR